MKKTGKISDQNPFRVPDGYFDEVNRKIISATSDKHHEVSRPKVYHNIRPFLLAAASVTVFLVLSYTAYRVISGHRITGHESAIINEEYYSPFINDLDIYSIEENAAAVTVPEQGPDVSDTDIIDYLVLDNIEINEIYEQL